MIRLHRYFIRQFLRFFLILTFGLSAFFSLLHIIDKIDYLMPYHPSLSIFVEYTLMTLPKYFLYTLPMATLISTVFVFAIATRRRETIAYKAAGGDIKKMLIPFIAAGMIISIVNFGIGEYVVPLCNKRAGDILFELKEDKKRLHIKQGNIWIRGKGETILHAHSYSPEKGMLRMLTLFNFSNARPSSIIAAKEAVWENGIWILKDVTKYHFVKKKVTHAEEHAISGIGDPEVIAKDMSGPEEMGIIELLDYREKLIESGYRNKKLDVDIFSRFLYPFTCLFMAILGFSIVLRKNIGSGVVGIAFGIIISLIYWFIYSFMLSLGYTGILPPLLAATSTPAMFAIASILMVRKIPR